MSKSEIRADASQADPTTIQLSNGVQIPRIGLGTSPWDDAATESALREAFPIGYRLVDTAANYGNEVGVGRAIRSSDLDRSEIVVTSKIGQKGHGRQSAKDAVRESLDRLRLDYIDVMLIHWPNPALNRYVEAWEGLNELLAEGIVRAIGTSNFLPEHIDRLIDATGQAPHINQIQLSPGMPRTELRDYHRTHGIVTEAWSPLGGEWNEALTKPLVQNLAGKYNRSPSQIVLRWLYQSDIVAIPKSSRQDRLRENLDVHTFALAPEDAGELDQLTDAEHLVVHPNDYGE